MTAPQPIDLDHGRRVIHVAYALFLQLQTPPAPVAPPPPPEWPAPGHLDVASDGGPTDV